jgi:predicted ATPase/DNA-binding CsgD family transcriptional regulator
MLRTLMPKAEGEGRRIVLVGGEPGSGKSRLVRELAREIVDEGVLVLYGACDAVVRTPYGPFAEALGDLVRWSEPTVLRADLGPTGGELIRLLPELAARFDDLPPPVEADQDTERHRLHIAVTDLLTSVSGRTPVLLVIEDAHWADLSTLLLIRHLGRAAAETRMLVLTTFRDIEAELPTELAETLVDLRRSEGVVRLRLEGLSDQDVAEFVRRASGGDFGADLPQLAQAIGDLTRGNAFLLCELWRTLLETGTVAIEGGRARMTRPLGALGTPEAVREVVSQRLSRLSPSTRTLLEVAAVAGPEFRLDTIRQASGLPEPDVQVALDEAVRSGMVEEVPAPGLVYRFGHELVRRAVDDRLTGLQRAELHLRVAEALEAAHPEGPTRPLADLAHHFAAAAPVADPRKAFDYNVLAARAAASALAFDEAAARFRAALDLGAGDTRERAELLLELGDAERRAGKTLDALATYRAAADIIRTLGDPRLLARVAIGFEEAGWRPPILAEGTIELLEEAVAALGDEDSPLRVQVLAGLSRTSVDHGDHLRGAYVREIALDMARRVGDKRGLGTVLVLGLRAQGLSTYEELLDQLTEAREIAMELGDIELHAQALGWRVPTYVALSDLRSARRETLELLEAASRSGQPFMLHIAEQYRSAIALAEGELDEAEAAAERCYDWSRVMTGRDAAGVYGIQMFGIRREQGRLAEVAPVMRALAASGDPRGAWRPGLAAMLGELGMVDETRRELARVASEGLEPIRQSLWLASLTYLADASAAAGAADVAALLYPEIEAHAGTNVMIGYGVACYGAADRYLGMLAATLGEWERAEEHLERAMELNRAMRAQTWVAHTAFEHGSMLLRRGRADDRGRAEGLLGEAAGLAERHGLGGLRARIRALGSSVASSGSLPDDLSGREAEILRLLARGLSNRQIGGELFISEHTVANHVRSILRKTGCANRTEAASYAHRRGIATS